jgi:hypothetical protein
MVGRLHAGIIYNPHTIDPKAILKSLTENDFYPITTTDVFWETEEQALFSVFDETNRK